MMWRSIESLIAAVRTARRACMMHIRRYFEFVVRIAVARHMTVVMIEGAEIAVFRCVRLRDCVQRIRRYCRLIVVMMVMVEMMRRWTIRRRRRITVCMH